MKKRQTNAERQLAHEQKQEALRKLSEEFRKILARGPDPNYPVTKLSIEEQIALGIPLDTGWVATMPLPGRSRKAAKPKSKP
jgi:hypothetical protein